MPVGEEQDGTWPSLLLQEIEEGVRLLAAIRLQVVPADAKCNRVAIPRVANHGRIEIAAVTAQLGDMTRRRSIASVPRKQEIISQTHDGKSGRAHNLGPVTLLPALAHDERAERQA